MAYNFNFQTIKFRVLTNCTEHDIKLSVVEDFFKYNKIYIFS